MIGTGGGNFREGSLFQGGGAGLGSDVDEKGRTFTENLDLAVRSVGFDGGDGTGATENFLRFGIAVRHGDEQPADGEGDDLGDDGADQKIREEQDQCLFHTGLRVPEMIENQGDKPHEEDEEAAPDDDRDFGEAESTTGREPHAAGGCVVGEIGEAVSIHQHIGCIGFEVENAEDHHEPIEDD